MRVPFSFHRRPPFRTRPRRRKATGGVLGAAGALVALSALVASAAAPDGGPQRPTGTSVLDPEGAPAAHVPADTQDVASVVFLVGDAGQAQRTTSPLLARLRAEVEAWSGALEGDSSVVVLFLGDNVYPAGIHNHDDGAFRRDSTRLAAQVWTVDGPAARRAGARGVFVPGNHDWGNLQGAPGLARLQNEGRLLSDLRRGGPHVSLRPRPGEPGPSVFDVGPARVAVLDTEWWLQSDDRDARDAAMDRLGGALLAAGSRPVIVASHHPLTSAGPHGGQKRGVLSRLRGASADAQDLESEPYQQLRRDLSTVFRQFDRPLIHAAGHDHSLQVLRTAGPGQPAWSLVSGAGSKLTKTGEADGLQWAGDRLGFMRLELRRDGGVELFVESPPEGAPRCRGDDAQACVARVAAAFETVYQVRLR